MDKIMIGIDFGTTNTSIAYMKYDSNWDNYRQENFLFKSKSTIKTLITYKDEDTYWIGDDALARSYRQPKGFVKSIKRRIIEDEKIYVPYVDKTEVDIVADILSKLKESIEPQLPLDTEIGGVVVGIPIGFSDISKNTYLKALTQSGFFNNIEEASKNTIFVSEPIAAVLDYNISLKDNKNIMVFDFGGGTLDLVIMKMQNISKSNELGKHDVLAKESGLYLGGDDFDKAILEDIVVEKYGARKLKRDLEIASFDEIYEVKDGIELMNAIQIAKEELSRNKIANISVLTPTLEIDIEITREEFELAIQPYIKKIKKSVEACVEQAKMSINSIDAVVLAGGSALVPKVQELLHEIFGRNKVRVHGDALTTIARGLALRGYNLEETDYSDILEHSYGIKIGNSQGSGTKISTILNKGQKIDEINESDDYFKEFELTDSAKTKNHFRITVCEDEIEIGTARIPIEKDLMKNSRFKLIFKIDENLDKLKLEVFDVTRKVNINIPIEEQYIKINKRGE